MRDGRWTTVTPSQFDHEREALHYLQTRLPDAEPYRAWSNFTFTASTGHINEIDLLVAGLGGLYLVEIKSWHGRLISRGPDWVQRTSSGHRTFPNPLHLANEKAKRLRSLLGGAKHKVGLKEPVPFVQAAIFMSEPSLRVELDPPHLHWVYGPEQKSGQPNTLPDIVTALLTQQPQDHRNRVSPTLSKTMEKLLAAINIGRSRKYYELGAWQMDQTPLDEGPTWQDFLARHAQLEKERRRVRIYLVERRAAKEQRESVRRAAEREAKVLQGINHPGVVRCDSMEDNDRGPALVFRHDERAMRLDHYIAQYNDRLDVDLRLRMVRELAETMAHVHGHRLYHRALSARSVLVTPDNAGRRDGTDPWLRPQLQISDWQAATRGADSVGGSFGVPSTSRHQSHLAPSALAYLAPEFDRAEADPVALDVFGLGTLAYLLLSGHAPAQQRSELLARLAADDGLRPSASADSVSEYVDELVQQATRPRPEERLTTVAEFLDDLEVVEDALTAPPSVHPAEAEDIPDLLEAKTGDVVVDWEIVRRLGTGSTSRAFLAKNLSTGANEVLKVALSDEKKSRLAAEARVLTQLSDSRIIHLVRQEPIDVGHRTALVLAHAGGQTLARKLRDDGRLTVDELERFSEDLFLALDYLEDQGVYHRDIKPDNIAVRTRVKKAKQLVLFDFSLAGVSVKETEAGTPRYLDPFIGTLKRQVYDWQAERYALAVTLHEMASGELPVWGDGATEPRFTDGPPGLKPDAFDSAIRDGLTAFFLRALDRDAKQRFESLQDMRDAWVQVFRSSDATLPVGSKHPKPEADEEPERARDEAAAVATRATSLEAAGLTPRATSAARELNVNTVGALLEAAPQLLFRMPGMGAKTRQELQRRVKEWRARFDAPTPSPTAEAERKKAKEAVDAATAGQPEPVREVQLHAVGLDAIAALLAPKATNRNATEVLATRLLLRLPDEHGVLPDLPVWPLQPPVAKLAEVTPARVGQILSAQRKRWAKEPVVGSVHADVVAMLADSGNVMAVSELAEALLTRRGSTQDSEPVRLAMAMAAVRAAVELDPALPTPCLKTRRHGDRVLVALLDDADDTASTDTDTDIDPAAVRVTKLLDYAVRLGKEADELAGEEVLPSPATVLRELTAVPGPEPALEGARVVRLAAAASERAAVSPRMEIYPRDLDLVRALRLAQAGVDSAPAGAADDQRGLTPEDVRRRVYARFPALAGRLPDHPRLHQLLEDAGFNLVWDGGKGRYQVPWRGGSAPSTPTAPRQPTRLTASPWTAESPELAAAARAEERLSVVEAGSGFRALTVRRTRYVAARAELVSRFDAEPVNVSALFVAKLHELVDPRPRPTWETVLEADRAEPGSRAALKLAEYAEQAWQLAIPSLREALGGGRPLLLHDAAPFGRYRAMPLLHDLAREARDGLGWLWLLCPSDDPGIRPRLAGTAVQVVTENEWITLPDSWVTNQHRAGHHQNGDVAS